MLEEKKRSGYTKSVSNHQASKMLSNGWTIDVITKKFNGLQGGI